MSKFRNEINSILRKLQNGDTSQQKVLYDGTINYLKMIALRMPSIKTTAKIF